MPKPTEHQLEILSTAVDAYHRADLADDGSYVATRAVIRAHNVLLDACVDCGMPIDGDEFTFAAETVTAWLVAA